MDSYQLNVITSMENILVVAGPGSGKTTTILEKVKYLLKNNININDILLISFTNKSVNDIKIRFNKYINVTTFHKLAIDILKYNNINFNICDENLLDYIIDEITITYINQKELLKHLKTNKLSINSYEYINFKNTIKSFIYLYKTNNKNTKDLKFIIKKTKDKFLIKFIISVFSIYEIEKKSTNTYDFDDLIIEATNILKENYNYHKYKYIIIDEFQDTSFIRLNLIKEIQKNSNSIITAVGDDAQSIFHFSGCDINIFLNFNKYFNNSKILYLKNTYRNSKEIVNVTSKFINKNPKQIKKDMISNFSIENAINIIYYTDEKNILNKTIDSINNTNILILSRNTFDINKYINKNLSYQNNEIFYKNNIYKYLTIHSSKGLEEDYVIILNCSNSLNGIPNKKEDNKLINLLIKNYDNYPYSEERRVFFVALTRCRKKVYLLVPKENPSIFIKEIKKLL